MVKIPDKIKSLIDTQGVIVIGTTGGNKFTNISPRIFFLVTDENIYWLDFFKHKSYRNFLVNPCVTVAVFDKEKFEGYQLRGIIQFVNDESLQSEIREKIVNKVLTRTNTKKTRKMSKNEATVIKFEPHVIYSLTPEQFSDLSISSDIDSTTLFCKT